MNLYSWLTEVIAIFHFLSISSTAISQYPNIVFIMSIHIFFFNKNIVCSSSISAFMANASNYPRFRTILFGIIITCAVLLYTASTSVVDILFVYSIIFSKVSFSVILNDPNCSDNASILFS